MSFVNKACYLGGMTVAVIAMSGMGGGSKAPPISEEATTNIMAAGMGSNNPPGPGSGSSGSGGTPTAPLGQIWDDADSQERARLAVENGLLGQSSQSLCARGANNILSYYVNGYGMSNSGANAHQMGPILESRYGMSAIQDNGVYMNGDTRVLTNSGVGHLETYMNGRWYSDFPQNTSGMEWGGYNGATLYRLPGPPR
jgi:hypothetical protein